MDQVLQWKHKCTAVLTCNKGCGTQIYFDPNNKSSLRENDTDGDYNTQESYLYWEAAGRISIHFVVNAQYGGMLTFTGGGVAGFFMGMFLRSPEIPCNNYRLISWGCVLGYSMDAGKSVYPRTGWLE